MSWGPSDEREFREHQDADRRRIKAHRDWWATGESAPQPLDCELCGDTGLSADSFIRGLGAVICDLCLERLMDTPEETL